ncbi:PAS fold family [Verrucomicrobiia bacterium DG1235]|nr:PAS fold family [Verrucomicrobiae bacterium DG1235]
MPKLSDSYPNIDAIKAEIENRIGLCPAFFLTAEDSPKVLENLWRQAQLSYLDNPLPSLFKDRLFTYLSRFCETPYCLARHCAFLAGQGHIAGDPSCEPVDPASILRLLKQPFPNAKELAERLETLAAADTPLPSWPAPEEELELCIILSSACIFLRRENYQECQKTLTRLLGKTRFNELLSLLAFIQTAHFWTETHPEIHFERDIKELLDKQSELKLWIRFYPSTVRAEINSVDTSQLPSKEEARRDSDIRFQIATQDHYLKRELYEKFRTNPEVIEFLDNSSIDGIWYWDIENPDREWMSPKFWTTLGFSPNEKQHSPREWQKLIYPEDLALSQKNFEKHCDDPKHPYDQLVRYHHKNGSTIWIRCHGLAIRNQDGKPIRMLGVHNDVTAAILTAGERASDQQFHAFFQGSAIGAIQLDSKWRLLRVNDRYCEMTGYSRSELLDTSPSNLDHPDDKESDRKAIARFINGSEPIHKHEKRYIRKDGSVIWVKVTVSPIYDERGAIIGGAGIVQDISENKQIEQNHAFLDRLHAELMKPNSPQKLKEFTLKALVKHLDVDGANFGIFTSDAQYLIVQQEFQDHRPSILGRHKISDFGAQADSEKMLAGQEIQVDDVNQKGLSRDVIERFNKIGVAAYLTEPLVIVKEAKSLITVTSSSPRKWKPHETQLLREVCSRLFPAIERALTEETLRESEERARLLLDNAPAAIAIFDRDMLYLSVSQRWMDDNKHTESLIGKHHYEVVQYMPDHWKAAHRRSLKGETVKANKDLFVDDNEQVRWIKWETRPWLNGDGEIGGIVLMTEEITDRVKAENLLEESERRAKLYLENAPAGIAVFDTKMRYLAASRRWLNDYGFDRDQDVIGKSHYHLFPEIPERWKDIHRRTLAGEIISDDKDEFIRADGTSQWIKWVCMPWTENDSQIGGLAIMAEDITDNVVAEKLQLESDLRFRSTFENAAVGIAHLSPEGNWLRVNQKICDMVDYSKEELLSMTFGDITHPDDLEADWDLARKVLVGDISNYSIDKRYIRRDGSTTWVSLTVSLQLSDDGSPDYFISITRDINAQKRAEDALLQREEELISAKNAAEKANRAKDEFLSVMSHELRTPLNPIIGFAQLLAQRSDEAFVKEASSFTLSSAQRMLSLVDSLLDFANLDRTNANFPLESFSLEELLAEVKALRETIEYPCSLQIRNGCDPLSGIPENAKLCGPLEPIRKVLSHLVGNAFKYAGDSGVIITLSYKQRTDPPEEYLQIEVSDLGPGVPPEYVPELFTPFNQADSSHTRRHGGLGLGLAISEKLVQQMNGSIKFRPNLPQGAVFTFSVPVRLVPASQRGMEALAHKTSTHLPAPSRPKILIVEDNQENADYFLHALREFDVEIIHVTSGEEAIKRCSKAHFEIAMIDISMSGLSGIETLEKLKLIPDFYEHTTAIAVTAHASNSMRQTCLKKGFHAFLSKPVTLAALRQTIQSLLVDSNV